MWMSGMKSAEPKVVEDKKKGAEECSPSFLRVNPVLDWSIWWTPPWNSCHKLVLGVCVKQDSESCGKLDVKFLGVHVMEAPSTGVAKTSGL